MGKESELKREIEKIDYDLQQIVVKEKDKYKQAVLIKEVMQLYSNKINAWLNILSNHTIQDIGL